MNRNKECEDRVNKDKEVESYLNGELSEEEKLKYEIAGELGLLDRVLAVSYTHLTLPTTSRV